MQPLNILGERDLADRFEAMRRHGGEILAAEGCAPADMEFQFYVVARYIGQMHDLQVPLDAVGEGAIDMAKLAQRFHEEHRQAYGIAVEGEPVLLVSARIRAIARVRKPSFSGYSSDVVPTPERTVSAWFEETGPAQIPLYWRQPWRPDEILEGPAIIQEYDSTTVVLPGQTWHVDEFGSIVIEEIA
jgi:N-methylhydantoinase A/oxoprolinase/acetone carboxylase beta subunit